MNDFRTEMRSWLSNPVTDAVADAIVRLLVTAKDRATTARQAKFGYTVRELRATPYDEYLETDHWQRTRRKALRMAGWTCRDCRQCALTTALELHVHHLTYKRLGRERPRDLRVLCAGCHEKEHGK